MWLSLTPIGSIHQNLGRIRSTATELRFLPISRVLAACLLACCLLLAKPSGSTLDTKEGYKTKTGSTSSVTLTLTPLLQSGEGDQWWPTSGQLGYITSAIWGPQHFRAREIFRNGAQVGSLATYSLPSGGSPPVVCLLTSGLSAHWHPPPCAHASAGNASHLVIPITAQSEGCSQPIPAPPPLCPDTGQVLVQGAKMRKHRVTVFGQARVGGGGGLPHNGSNHQQQHIAVSC